MQSESLVKLVGSGNTSTVEEEWMRLIESPEVPAAALSAYQPVLAELCRVGKTSQAETLAWAAIEGMSARATPSEVLTVAGAYLLAIPESKELRAQVTALYRSTHADREGLDVLLAEAGLAGGRPVRRALRTVELCLGAGEGGYLALRDEDGAARVDGIDRATWTFTIDAMGIVETLGAVHLADRYRLAEPTEFRVLRFYARDELRQRLEDDPGSIVVDLCRERLNSVTSEALEALFVPDLLTESEWKKWWANARSALKRLPNVKIEGRSPYVIRYVDAPVARDEVMWVEFERGHDPITRFRVVEKYLRECHTQGEAPSKSALARCYEALAQQARQLTQKHAATAALAWTVTRRVGEASSIDGAAEGLTPLLKVATDLPAVLAPIEDSSLLDLACASLVEARPNDWREQLIAVLPSLASSSCDHVVKRLIDGGCSTVDLEPVLQKIFASPIKCFDALLWLWDGPSDASLAAKVVPLTILTRVLRTLDECRRSETVPKEIGKKIAARARAMLSARRFGRFVACVGGIEGGMALALRTQISQLDNLGRAVREDLLTQLKPFLPQAEPKPVVEPWSREDVLYATKAGLARKQEEIDHLVRVKMKENAIAIGAAAERGDLSENSEYKFALEERDLLRARLAQMNSEVSMAQVISSRDVPTDRIGIGSRVVFRRVNDGESYQIVFVGPWDADSSKVWINYKAPLAQSVMGKRVGDVIQFDHTGAVGEYEVVELHNALVE